jgi:hypothetical protein
VAPANGKHLSSDYHDIKSAMASFNLQHPQLSPLHRGFRPAALPRVFPNSSSSLFEILCQIKKWFGTFDGHGLDNSEWVLNTEEDKRFTAQVGLTVHS